MKIILNILRVVLAFFLLSMTLFSTQPAQAIGIKIGLVTDGSGIADMSFNYMAHQGLLQAESAMGVAGSLYESGGDYAASLETCVTDGNKLCIAVGWSMGDAVAAAAAKYPDTNFAILDYSPASPPTNLRGIIFSEKQAGYLAGALAGKMTSSNVIGVIAGMAAIPPVISFVEGYRNGAQCANPNVSVLVNYTGTFNDPVMGAAIAQQMMTGNADVIFSAAGSTGNGAILHSAQNGAWSIGVDADQYLSLFGNGTVDGSNKLLSSAMKRLDLAVYQTIEDQVDGVFTSGTVLMELADDGVSLAPYHETDASVPQLTRDHLASVKAGIIASSIDVDETCRTTPKIGVVTDANGTSDQSFNWMASQGLWQAQTGLGVMGTVYETSYSSEYETRLQQCVNDGNEFCFAVGWSMGDAVIAVANANPDTDFAILDNAPASSPPANLRQILFNEKEAGYLAGALAGKMTSSNVIGDIGGFPIPAVVSFVEGYRNGAQCANTNVNVLMVYTNTFNDPTLGATTAQNMMTQGADVIFAAAGATGNGAILYGSQHGAWSIGIDSDQYHSLYEGGTVAGSDKLLSSAMKRIDNAVYMSIEDLVDGVLTFGTVTLDLAAGGVGLAPYHETDGSIPLTTKNYIDNVKARIISGSIDLNQACRLTVNSIGAQDGWVLESSEISKKGGSFNATDPTLRLGDDKTKKQYLGILSFNTSGLPDAAVITSVTLKVKKQSVTGGGDPLTIFQGFMVDIKKGIFGTAALQTTDFQTLANKSFGPFKPALASGWYSINLTSGKAYINKVSTNSGLTQFRLRFNLDDNNNALANYLNLYTGNAPAASRPQLILRYSVP